MRGTPPRLRHKSSTNERQPPIVHNLPQQTADVRPWSRKPSLFRRLTVPPPRALRPRNNRGQWRRMCRDASRSGRYKPPKLYRISDRLRRVGPKRQLYRIQGHRVNRSRIKRKINVPN